MKKLKIICVLFVSIFCYVNTLNAQSSLTAEVSQLYTTFKFIDSKGNDLSSDYSGILTGTYGVGYRYVSYGGFKLVIMKILT